MQNNCFLVKRAFLFGPTFLSVWSKNKKPHAKHTYMGMEMAIITGMLRMGVPAKREKTFYVSPP